VNKPTLSKVVCILFVFCTATAIPSPAQVLTTLHSFGGGDGANPRAGLLQATDGNFYGTTRYGGAGGCGDGCGTVFKITPNGTLTTLHSFNGSDGAYPYAELIQAGDGNFYGTAIYGGAYNYGTVFGMLPDGYLVTLYSFCSKANCADGADPSGLLQASDGNFYGTTSAGGAKSGNCSGGGCGTVFKITPNGLTTLHSFNYYDDGAGPDGLLQASDGNFYGTTAYGGGRDNGTVFQITPDGTLTTLHDFSWDDGVGPDGLLQARDGNLYGTAIYGGAYNQYYCSLYCGTVFRMSPSGGFFAVLHSFNGTDGANPYSGLVQARDGNFYGTTSAGGASGNCNGGGCGTVFKITPDGTLTTLHNFGGSDGAGPYGALIQASDGNFYGTTFGGGAYNGGTVFRLVTVRTCIVCPSAE
jgi:uncharacterized repeat protein (TIGR03803 family)